MKRSALILPVILSLLLMPMWAFAQQATGSTSGTKAGAKHGYTGYHKGKMSKEMAEKCAQWREKLEAMDKSLNDKVAAMNAAQGDEKVIAMAGLLNEMVTQRKEMRDMMAQMHHGKMGEMCARMGHDMGMHGKDGGGMMHHKMGTGAEGGAGAMGETGMSTGSSS